MPPRSHFVVLLVVSMSTAALAGGCGDNAALVTPDSGSTDDDSGAGAPGVGLAVVNSDFATTSISLLHRGTGRLLVGDCINSGTRPPGNTLPLSGDVGLPSRPQPGNPLVVIDHANGVLTWLDPATCTPLRQLDVSTGFFANPHDLIGVTPTKAYVTRYERNGASTPASANGGDDVLIIDPSIPAITGRIDLSSHAAAVADTVIQARPDRARLVDDKLVVALNNIDASFHVMGQGRVVVIDTATDQVTSTIDIPELKNCGSLSYVDKTRTLVVACNGDYNADQAATSGIAYIDMAASPPALIRSQLTPFGGRVLGAYAGTAMDGAYGFGVTPGGFAPGDPKDQLWVLDVATSQATAVDEASHSFTYGSLADDPVHHRFYLTDGDDAAPRVHRWDYTDPTKPVRDTSVLANPLPAREIAWY